MAAIIAMIVSLLVVVGANDAASAAEPVPSAYLDGVESGATTLEAACGSNVNCKTQVAAAKAAVSALKNVEFSNAEMQIIVAAQVYLQSILSEKIEMLKSAGASAESIAAYIAATSRATSQVATAAANGDATAEDRQAIQNAAAGATPTIIAALVAMVPAGLNGQNSSVTPYTNDVAQKMTESIEAQTEAMRNGSVQGTQQLVDDYRATETNAKEASTHFDPPGTTTNAVPSVNRNEEPVAVATVLRADDPIIAVEAQVNLGPTVWYLLGAAGFAAAALALALFLLAFFLGAGGFAVAVVVAPEPEPEPIASP